MWFLCSGIIYRQLTAKFENVHENISHCKTEESICETFRWIFSCFHFYRQFKSCLFCHGSHIDREPLDTNNIKIQHEIWISAHYAVKRSFKWKELVGRKKRGACAFFLNSCESRNIEKNRLFCRKIFLNVIFSRHCFFMTHQIFRSILNKNK